MQIGILINDKEYREALVERLSNYDNDLLVNIINGSESFSKNSLILTDIDPSTLDKNLLIKLKPRTLFLTASFSPNATDNGLHLVFKYCSVADLLSEASLVYKEWQGIGYGRNHSAKIISVWFENDAMAYNKCMSFARQILYRKGDRVLVVSLSYLNDYGSDEAGDFNQFARMMYSISTGRHDAVYGHTYTDSYGISALMLKKGRNPMAYLDKEELMSVIASMATFYDTLILDMGTCYRKQNLFISEHSDNVVFFENGRRYTDLVNMLGKESMSKVIIIRQSGDTEDAVAIDDVISQIYGNNIYESNKSKNYKKIRS